MFEISISEQSETTNDVAYILRNIAEQIEYGYTSGVDPNWSLEGEEEPEEEESEDETSEPMTNEEMIKLLETHSAIEVCKMKYERFLAFVESDGEYYIDNIKSSTCALCYIHGGKCENCEIPEKTGLHCSSTNDSTWGKLNDAVNDGDTDGVIEYTKEMIELLNSLEE